MHVMQVLTWMLSQPKTGHLLAMQKQRANMVQQRRRASIQRYSHCLFSLIFEHNCSKGPWAAFLTQAPIVVVDGVDRSFLWLQVMLPVG